MRFVAALWLAFAGSASPIRAADSGPANGGYVASLFAPKSVYKPGEDVTLTLTIQNVGSAPIYVEDDCATRMDTGIVVTELHGISPGPSRAYLSRIACNYTGPIQPDLYLAPGAKEFHQFSLVKDAAIALPAAGAFTVQMFYRGWDDNKNAPVGVKTNVVTLTVAP